MNSLTFNNRTIRRMPTDFEGEVLEFIKKNPGLKPDEIAGHWDDSQEVYDAIAFLWANDYAEYNRQTRKIVAWDVRVV